MRVTQGWSGEVEANRWAKFSISVDETDFVRLCVEHGPWGLLRQAEIDDKLQRIPARLVFGMLAAEAERLVLIKLVTSYGMTMDNAAPRMNQLAGQQAVFLKQVLDEDGPA